MLADLADLWIDTVVPELLPDDEKADAILADALDLLCNQGDIFIAAGIVFLDPGFATELIKPLLDHRLSKEFARTDVEEYVRATPGADRGAVGRLLRAIDDHAKNGLLSADLLPFFWRATELDPKDYDHAVRMLCDAGTLVELPAEEGEGGGGGGGGGAPARRLVMPMRMPKERPAKVSAKWVPEKLEAGVTQLGVRFEFFGSRMPAGAMQRCVAGCGALPGCLLLHVWQNGVLLHDEWGGGDAKALLELQHAEKTAAASLTAQVRGVGGAPALWRVLALLVGVVEAVLSEYSGTYYDELLVCPVCCAAGRWAKGAASEWELHEELDGKSSAYCTEADQSVPFRPDGATIVRPKTLTSMKGASAAGAQGGMGPLGALFEMKRSVPKAPSLAAAPAAAAAGGCRFFFVDAERLKAFEGKTMPHYQELLRSHPGLLVPRVITFAEACAGTLTDILTVSHRWMAPHDPDADGTQLRATQAHLKAHPETKWVWYDAWCMPQGQRTEAEIVEFKATLKEVNILYLGTRVLIILDLSYLSRFWTQFEAWLAMQQPTKDGLRPATPGERRWTIVPIYAAPQEFGTALESMWAKRSPEEAYGVLSQPDVTVTSQADKVTQLGKLKLLDSRVREELRS
jgi:hypothetical protein